MSTNSFEEDQLNEINKFYQAPFPFAKIKIILHLESLFTNTQTRHDLTTFIIATLLIIHARMFPLTNNGCYLLVQKSTIHACNFSQL